MSESALLEAAVLIAGVVLYPVIGVVVIGLLVRSSKAIRDFAKGGEVFLVGFWPLFLAVLIPAAAVALAVAALGPLYRFISGEDRER